METDSKLHYGSDYRLLPMTSIASGEGIEVRPDLYCYTIQIVNICFIGTTGDKWLLVDAGMPGSAEKY